MAFPLMPNRETMLITLLNKVYLIGNQVDTNTEKWVVFSYCQKLFMTSRCLVIYACLMNISDAILKK